MGFREAGLGRARDLIEEYAEVLESYGRVRGAAAGAARRLGAGERAPLALGGQVAGGHLRAAGADPVFEAWAAGLTELPPLDFLLDVVTPCARWEELTEAACSAT